MELTRHCAIYPLVMSTVCLLLKMTIEIVDLPIIIKDIEDGDFP